MTNMTADELRDLAARTYRTCVERQARIAKRDEEARRAHAAILARCDEVERELRELRDDHIETLAHLVSCVEVLGLPRDTDGPALVEAVRARASEGRQDAARALSIAETKSAGADVIVSDAEARRVAAEMRAIQAEGRAERLERELAEARRGYDTVTAALEGGTGDPLATALRRAEKAERERDEIDAHKCQLSLMLRDAQRALGARKRVRIIAREPLDPAPQSPPTEIVLTSGPAGILFHVADAGSVGVLEDFLRYLGHEIVVDKPATLASPIANTGLDELVREAGEKGDM